LIYGKSRAQEKGPRAITDTPKIASLVRYPMKGLAGQVLPSVTLTPGEGMPVDRAYAVENGARQFDAESPKWLPKGHFLQLRQHERLASLGLGFDDQSHTLTLLRGGRQVARGGLQTKLGRQMIEQFLAAFMKSSLLGPPRIVFAPGHSFTDIADKAVHIVNLETVRDLSRAAGIEPDPARFRANIYLDGLPAWEERQWLGKTISCGPATLQVFNETTRCEATSVDPNTAQRGLSIPAVLQRTWGHAKLGLYATVISGGAVSVGEDIALA
jgi:uncharacterized protein